MVTSKNRKICMTCSFSADELTGCVGVIHSAQLDNLTLTVLSVERSGGENCTVDELMEGNYSVAVFGLKGNMLEQEPASVTTVSTAAVMSDQTSEQFSCDIIYMYGIGLDLANSLNSVKYYDLNVCYLVAVPPSLVLADRSTTAGMPHMILF